MNIEITPATEAHARELIRRLRAADRAEIMSGGLRPGRAVLASLRSSVWSRAALVDGEVAAIWGVGGSLLGGLGRPWLLTGTACERVSPLRFARIYRGQVVSMLTTFARLENFVDTEYTGAVRMLRLAGFSIDDPEPIGKNGALFRRFGMRV